MTHLGLSITCRESLRVVSSQRRASRSDSGRQLAGFVRSLVVMCVLTLALTTSVLSQESPPVANDVARDADWHFRHELFQMLLEERGLSVESSLESALASPQESVVVLFGRQARSQVGDVRKLLPFVDQGGTVLVATDRSAMMGVIASFVAGPVTSDDEATQYQSLPDCLRVTDLDRDHPLMQDVGEVIINRSGWLSLIPSSSMNWQVVASVPQSCSPRRSRGQPLIAVSQRKGKGTMIIASDPSLFTNSMLWHGDNAILAIRMSEMLCRDNKRRLAFLIDGQPLASYRSSPLLQQSTTASPPNPPSPRNRRPPPKPTWESTLRLANSVIQNVEESNILNEAVINHPRYPNRRLYPLVIFFSLLAVTALWLLSKLSDTSAARPPLPKPRMMKTASDIEGDDTEDSLRYGVAAQILAREFCRELSSGCELPPEWPQCWAPATLLPIWDDLTKSQRRDLSTLVELAARPNAPHISPRRLRQLGEMLRRTKELHRSASSVS